MAAYIDLTNRFLNRDKRYAESVVTTCPAQYEAGSPRQGTSPKYIKSGDAYTAQNIEADTLIKKVYLIVDEAFPSGTTASVDIGGTAFFSDVAVDATGVQVATVEDTYFKNAQTVTVGFVNGSAGTEITEGVLRVVVDSVSPSLKNGNYAS